MTDIEAVKAALKAEYEERYLWRRRPIRRSKITDIGEIAAWAKGHDCSQCWIIHL